MLGRFSSILKQHPCAVSSSIVLKLRAGCTSKQTEDRLMMIINTDIDEKNRKKLNKELLDKLASSPEMSVLVEFNEEDSRKKIFYLVWSEWDYSVGRSELLNEFENQMKDK